MSCSYYATKALGTIKVERGATLTAYGIDVIGNIQAEGEVNVRIFAKSKIGSRIQNVQGKRTNIHSATITGDIQFESNNLALRATRNQVGVNLPAFQNMGGVNIANNLIDGNLQCKENTPRPTGCGNIVEGSKEDQCKNL